MNSKVILALGLLLLGAFSAGCSRPAPRLQGEPLRTEPWSREVVEAMASLPLQADGRVKPLATLAAFTLYHVHGRRDLQYTAPSRDGGVEKVTLEPTEWLLDVWCFPDQAAEYPLFRIEHSGVLDALGIANEGQKQGFEYLSYKQLLERGDKLGELSRKHRQTKAQFRSVVEEHLVQLFDQLVAYHNLHQQLGAMHADFELRGDALRALFGGKETARLGAILREAAGLRALLRNASEQPDPKYGNAMEVAGVLSQVVEHDGGGPLLLPPVLPPTETDTWHGLGEVVELALTGAGSAAHVGMLGHLQDAIAADSMAGKEAGLRKYRDAVVAAASARGEYGKVDLESYYYRASWHYKSLHWFLFGFVLAAVGWLLPRNRLVWWASMGVSTLALGMLVFDVGLRCVITERPPIKNLYDTFLFIAGVGVLTSLVVEWVLPRRIGLALAPLLGALLVMFARLFEVADGQDTMKPLVAVLDSNFWLATHVTIINIGYAAGLVAALLANAWILVRVLRIAHPADSLAKALVRMTYGVTCFSLMFAVVGTILGGVWANDSWGRFWGWDPKENGALMICLSQIALLHARMSGWVRDFGFVVWASVTGMVVLFSWFHVNLLGVGLHNYGFSSGLRDAVWTGYTVELATIGIGAVDVLLRPNPVRRAPDALSAAAALAE